MLGKKKNQRLRWWVRGDVILWFFVGLEVLYLLHNFFFWFGQKRDFRRFHKLSPPRRVAKTSPRGLAGEAAPQLERTQALQFLAPKLANLAQSLSAEIRWVKPRGVHSLFHLPGVQGTFWIFCLGCCLWLMVVCETLQIAKIWDCSTKKTTRGFCHVTCYLWRILLNVTLRCIYCMKSVNSPVGFWGSGAEMSCNDES